MRPSAAPVLLFGMLQAAAAPAQTGHPTATAAIPVDLHLTVGERGPDAPWELKVENTSPEAIVVVADPRLLWFEAVVPSTKKPIECRLPKDLVPPDASPEAVVTLEPGEDVVRTFDPRFVCFDEKQSAAFTPGSVLTPRFGWPSATKTVWRKGKRVEEPLPPKPPYVAVPSEPTSSLIPVKNIEAHPLTVGLAYAAWSPSEDAADGGPPPKDPRLAIVGRVDAQNERGVVATVRLTNPTPQSLRFFFRRELITFEVLGPDGLVRCKAGPDERFPEKTAFITLAPKGSTTLASRLVELCPPGTFSRPGFYVLSAQFDAAVDGSKVGLRAWTGTVRTERPAPVRVHQGELPFLVVPPPPPQPPPVPAGPAKPTGPAKRTAPANRAPPKR